ncbi:hypothetical protein LIER_05935 [Lithospermum erythrorhizon]|uniref:Uncharacterized protein n=1 Tax=Lithospermum erythrorhizon TaxID=34254 RepID=A0AAV3P3N8_LITER
MENNNNHKTTRFGHGDDFLEQILAILVQLNSSSMPASNGDDHGGSAAEYRGEQTSWKLNMSGSTHNN